MYEKSRIDEPNKNQIYTDKKESIAPNATRIFIVHGHDHAIKDNVTVFIHSLKLEPIIISDKANAGKTLIEKLEEYSDVSFAVVLLSPDDLGHSLKDSNEKTRARQNVIFELGLFIGRLGRENVCPIVNNVAELPSDYLGIVYIPYDEKGAWKLHLIREFVKAGFNIDPKNL